MPTLPVDLLRPHTRARDDRRATRDFLSARAAAAALAGLWLAALLLAGGGARVSHGEWPGVYDWLMVTPLLTLLAMPTGLLDLFGLPYHGGSALLLLVGLVFWSVMLVLHVLALLTGRRVYVALIAAVLAPAAWNWAVHASGLMGI